MTTRNIASFLIATCAVTALLADNGTWTAPDGGDWNTASNWDDTIAQGSGSTASFPSGTGTVNNDMDGLALLGFTLDGDGLTFTGNPITLDADGFITVTGGNHTVGLPFTLSGATAVTAVSGHSLTLGDQVTGAGGLTVAGGRVALSAANTYAGPTVLTTGILEIATVQALGTSPADPANLTLGEGTLRYTGPSAILARGYTIAPTNSGSILATVIEVTDPATVLTIAGQVAAPAGSFIKTGEGTLAYTYPGTQELSKSRVGVREEAPLVIDENGSAGTNGYAVFTVDRGRVIFGAPGQTNLITSVAWVGTRTLASPRLDVTGGVTRMDGSYFTIGRGTGTKAAPQQPSVYVSNGALLDVPSFVMGYRNDQADFYSEPLLHVDNATFLVRGDCFISENDSLLTTVTVTNHALFQCDSPATNRGMAVSQTAGAQTFVNIAGNSTGSTYQLKLGRGGNLNVTQNSVFELDSMSPESILNKQNLGTARFNGATLKQRTEKLSSDWFVGVTNLLYGAGGMTIGVASHAWLDAVPKPDPDSPGGIVTKTGPGTLVMRPTPNAVSLAAGRLALSTESPNTPAAFSGVLIAAPGTEVELGGIYGAGNMLLNLNGAPLSLAPPSLASTPARWIFGDRALGRADGIIRLTSEIGSAGALANQRGAAWLSSRQKMDRPWTAAFSYICWATGTDPADGIALVIHNDPRGTAALGGLGGNLGYTGTGEFIDKSVAVGFNITGHQVRFGKHGTFTFDRGLPSGMPKLASHPAKTRVTVSYDGAGTLSIALTSPDNIDFYAAWPVDIPGEVESDQAWLGFTGATAGRWGQHSVTDVTFDNGTAAQPSFTRTGGRVALGPGETLTARTAASASPHGYALAELTYADQAVLDITDDAQTVASVPLPPPTLTDPGLWQRNGSAYWKAPGLLSISLNQNDSPGTAFTTNLYPVTGSWTAKFRYDIGLRSTPPADYVCFAIQNETPTRSDPWPNVDFAIMWRYYDNSVTTTALRMFTNNVATVASLDIAPVDLKNGTPADMTIIHDSAAKTVTVITEQGAGAYTNVFTGVDMAAAVNARRAHIGFTAFTGGLNAENLVSDLSFVWDTPEGAAPATAPGYIAFEKLTGTGTLVKRGTAAFGLLGDIDRSTAHAALRLEEGGLILRKTSSEPVDLTASRTDWIFSPLGQWGADGTLQVCPALNDSHGTGTTTRRVRIDRPWTADFSFTPTNGSPSPADAFCLFLHNDTRGPGHSEGKYGAAGFQGMTPSFGICWYFFPGNQDGNKDTVSIGRNGGWNSSTRQSHPPLYIASNTTHFTVSYNPAARRLTSVMTQGAVSVTNVFNDIDIPADVGSDFAYLGFGSGTGGSYADMRIADLLFTVDNNADTQPDEVYLASLILPDLSANTVTLDTSVPAGTFRIATATLGDGATLGLASARQPGTLIIGTAAQAADAAYDIAAGNILALPALNGGTALTKRGFGTLALTGPADCTGDTRLESGTLALAASNMPRGTDLHVTSGAALDLAFTGKQYIRALYVDGVAQPGGTYTSAKVPWITGSGILIVTFPPTGTTLMVK